MYCGLYILNSVLKLRCFLLYLVFECLVLNSSFFISWRLCRYNSNCGSIVIGCWHCRCCCHFFSVSLPWVWDFNCAVRRGAARCAVSCPNAFTCPKPIRSTKLRQLREIRCRCRCCRCWFVLSVGLDDYDCCSYGSHINLQFAPKKQQQIAKQFKFNLRIIWIYVTSR